MNQLLWVNSPGIEPRPYLVTNMNCTMQHLMLRQHGVSPTWDTPEGERILVLSRLREAETERGNRSAYMSLSPAEKFFWRTRLVAQGIKVAQFKIFLPVLCWHSLLDEEGLAASVTCSSYPMEVLPCPY